MHRQLLHFIVSHVKKQLPEELIEGKTDNEIYQLWNLRKEMDEPSLSGTRRLNHIRALINKSRADGGSIDDFLDADF